MICVSFTLFIAIIVSIYAQNATFPDCKSGPLATFPICNQSLPARQRAADLISRMNVSEKISQLVNSAAAIHRLGLPSFQWWSEALHGVAKSPGVHFGGDLPAATSFPMPINYGAAFNMSLVHAMATVISTEARAFNNEGRAGLVFFSPNINIFRDPRWGRGQETPGEDPFLTSQYVYSFINGLQRSEDERYLKVAADCKHYAAYDLENWNGTDRFHFNAIVTDQDLFETYLPPFESCLRDAKAASMMCSYNSINGIPACAHRFLIQTVARDAYGFDGFVVSDCDAVDTIYDDHHYTDTREETVAVALHAGTDLDCGTFYGRYSQSALDNKTIVEADIDQALERSFTILVRLGYFDPPEQQPYRQYSSKDVDTMTSRELTLQAAQESIVLLKNANRALPLDMNQLQNKTIALIGPLADATISMQGNYHGIAPYLISPQTGFHNITGGSISCLRPFPWQDIFFIGTSITISYARGCWVNDTDQSSYAKAIELARNADVVIFFAGIDQSVEREYHDRTLIELPGIQLSLLQQVEKVAKSPVHVVIMSGSSLDLTYARDSNQCASLLWMGYPGQSGGLAIANVMFGKYNPGGRLPMTFYPASYVDAVSMFDMSMRPSRTNPGRTYKFYTGQPVFEFGHGLSYTTFNYSWSSDSNESIISIDFLANQNHDDGKKILAQIYRVNVTNTGSVLGDDVVLGFIIPSNNSFVDPSPPLKQLFGFERVRLDVGQTTQVFFPLNVQSLLRVAHDGSKWLEPGSYRILIGTKHMHTVYLRGRPMKWSSF